MYMLITWHIKINFKIKEKIVKKIIQQAILAVVLMSAISVSMFAASVSVALQNPSISPRPLDPVELNGQGVITFEMTSSNAEVPAYNSFDEPNLQIDIGLLSVKVTNDDLSLITVTNYLGEAVDYFNVLFRSGKIWFEQKAPIPGDSLLTFSIPITVIQNTKATENNGNGFNANLAATDQGTSAESSASTDTYTKEIPSAPEVDLIDGTDVNESTPTTVLTNDSTPEINGTCEAGLEVTVQIDGEDIEPTVTCKDDGTFSVVPTNPISEGEHNVTSTQTNPDTNVTSPTSPVDYLTVDTTAPSPLSIDSVDGQTGSPVTTIDTTPEINGTCEAGLEVTVQIDGVDIAPKTMCTDEGTYTMSPDTPLSIGSHNVTSRQIDEAGNVTTTDPVALTVEYPVEPAPTLETIDGNASNPVETNNTKPVIEGNCTAGDEVTAQIDGVDIEPTVTCELNQQNQLLKVSIM